MKLVITIFFSFCFVNIYAAEKDSTIIYHLPDSITAVSFITDVNIKSVGKKESFAGIKEGSVTLTLEADRNTHEVSFQFPSSAIIVATGIHVGKEKHELEWKFDWKLNTNYKLLIACKSDSADNFEIYSGYILLPAQQKWKLIGTCRINGQRENIKTPATIFSTGNKSQVQPTFSNVWVQKEAGSWIRLDKQTEPDVQPVINPLPNVDSVQQFAFDVQAIQKAIFAAPGNNFKDTAGVYYKIINAGSGKSFTVNDSITVHYQLRIFGSTEIISGNETEAFTFPLKVLIKAWQIAVPLVKTGGKIKLIIPSGLAYSIRTRAPKIPPNSILEFDVEVLDAKSTIR